MTEPVIPQVIILDGPDETGKSTLAEKLSYPIIHRGRPKDKLLYVEELEDSYSSFEETIINFLNQPSPTCLCLDRSVGSDLAEVRIRWDGKHAYDHVLLANIYDLLESVPELKVTWIFTRTNYNADREFLVNHPAHTMRYRQSQVLTYRKVELLIREAFDSLPSISFHDYNYHTHTMEQVKSWLI